jgi:DNA-binding MurR/RpiR family transcriptional regulator
LSARQQRDLARMADTGKYTITDLAEVFTVSCAAVYRTLQRVGPPSAAS